MAMASVSHSNGLSIYEQLSKQKLVLVWSRGHVNTKILFAVRREGPGEGGGNFCGISYWTRCNNAKQLHDLRSNLLAIQQIGTRLKSPS